MSSVSEAGGSLFSIHGTVPATLLAEVSAAPQARLVAGITGSAGTGKSLLLAGLERHYRAAGIPVRRAHADLDAGDIRARDAVLIDDAHQLTDTAIARMHSLVFEREVSLVVAYRPWPQPTALGRLAAVLGQHHLPVCLGPFTRDELGEYAAEALGENASQTLIDRVAHLTGGMPWLVQRILGQPRGQNLTEPSFADEVMQQLGGELAAMDADLHELLLALAVGFDLSDTIPQGSRDSRTVDERVATARAAGMLLPGDRLVPLVRNALLQFAPMQQLRELQRNLVDRRSADGRSLDDVASSLARGGLRDPRVARTLEHAADVALPADPALAATRYREATAAGLDELTTAARRGQAAAAVGDLDGAGRIVDDLLREDHPPDITRAVDVAAAVWARRGMLEHAAEAYRWLQPVRAGTSVGLAAVALVGAGDREGAEEMMKGAIGASPTLLTAALNLMGEGALDSVGVRPGAALSSLVRASDLLTASGTATVPFTETPAALAALLAVNGGELDVADSVIDAALAGDQGGAAARPRLLLLRGWVAMHRDRPDLAHSVIAQASSGDHRLTPRDEFLLRALEVGLARRSDDAAALVAAWKRAREDVMHVVMDLYTLLPLGELVIAAARLRDSRRLEPSLASGWALLTRLGDPPLWSVPLHWACVQAAILTERPEDLAPHATALVRASEQHRLAAALAAAGRGWMSVLRGDVDVATIEAAARGMARMGFTWEASRLAGHAAVRVAERKDMARLLSCARELRPGSPATVATSRQAEPAITGGPTVTAGASATHTTPIDSALSPREREVARLVLEGKTYREIGDAIFISPRTAEHHIARIRRRLGATTRSELLAELRRALGDDAT